MTLDDVKRLDMLQTRSIAEATRDERTHAYIVKCLQRFFAGDYGTVPQEDTDANNAELAAGEGRIVARYRQAHELQEDIYIIAVFSDEMQGVIDANHIMLMYCSEY